MTPFRDPRTLLPGLPHSPVSLHNCLRRLLRLRRNPDQRAQNHRGKFSDRETLFSPRPIGERSTSEQREEVGRGGADIERGTHLETCTPSPASFASLIRRPLPAGERRIFSYAAFFAFAAIPTSARKMPVAPLSRSSGVSHSSKNTTFMSGRTRAPASCLAM